MKRMWIELTDQGTNQAVWVNSDLVTHITELPQEAAAGCKLYFANGVELIVKESLDRVSERLQLS